MAAQVEDHKINPHLTLVGTTGRVTSVHIHQGMREETASLSSQPKGGRCLVGFC